ncbi:MAG: DNA-3-methyladenine glycosylase I [Alphaproteobacteria bacterium]
MSITKKCRWALGSPLEEEYHDNEWGQPKYDDAILFEMLVLEGAQAGLSWRTILYRRKGYRAAFDGFNVQKVAQYNEEKQEELRNNPAIIRNRLKIKSAVNNAQKFIEVQKEFGSFSQYFWNFTNHKPIINKRKTMSDVPATTELSDKISKDMKKRGFSFVGSTIIYAYMQSIGMINDHLLTCPAYGKH